MLLKTNLFDQFIKNNSFLQHIDYWDEEQQVIFYLQNNNRVVITYPLMYGNIDRSSYFNYKDTSLLSKKILIFKSAMDYLRSNTDNEFKYIITEPILINNLILNKVNRYVLQIFDKLKTHFPTFIENDYKLFYTAQNIFINAHYDPTDRLMIQLKGRKKILLLPSQYIFEFNLYPTTHIAERNLLINDIRSNNKISKYIQEFILNEGDILLIPKFWIHQIETESESLSLTISEKSIPLNESLKIINNLEFIDLNNKPESVYIYILQLWDFIDREIIKLLGIDTLKDYHTKWLNNYYPNNLSKDEYALELYDYILNGFPIVKKLYHSGINKFFIEHSQNYNHLLN